MKKRVCVFKSDIYGGGTEKAAINLAHLLYNANNYEVFILDIFNPDNGASYFIDKKINKSQLNKKHIGNKYLSLLVTSYRLYRFLKVNKIDYLINVQPIMGLYTLIVTKVLRIKNIIWEHANFYQYKNNKIIQFIRKMELRYADYYILLTKRDMENFKKNYKIKCKINYIYNHIPEINFVKNYDTNSKVIISAGHLKKNKGFHVLIEIATEVLDKYPDWKLHIYGDGEEKENLQLMIDKAKTSKQIKLMGRESNMNKVYQSGAFYVMTSEFEGLPLVLLEAKQWGLPCISFDIETGPDEIIRDGINGFLVPYGDKSLLKEKVELLIIDEQLRIELANNASCDIELFSSEAVKKKWSKILS